LGDLIAALLRGIPLELGQPVVDLLVQAAARAFCQLPK